MMEVPYDHGEGMRTYASRHGLYHTYFRCLGLEMAVFPYEGNDERIGDTDVIYVRDNDVWRLQDDYYNSMIQGHDPVPANSVSE
jgi:hypothetical protein